MRYLIVFIFCLGITSCTMRETSGTQESKVTRIAFGSCSHQNDPQPILEKAAGLQPDVFVYLGDNIYSDTYSMDTLRLNYGILGAKPEFRKLKAATPILATWDDHDYGWNDAGRHYPFKEQSKEIFLDFFGVVDSTVLTHPGIYHSKILEKGGKKIQFILLDMRTFRDKVLPYNGNRKGQEGYDYGLEYSPYETEDSTMLGSAQWQWLEAQLRLPADLRVICSSTQFSITHNGYEAWANFPHEQKRFIELVRSTKANGVLFISGDVHYAEISRISEVGMYPLYDVTSSGITSVWDFATPNDNRIDGPVMENNFGLITVDWSKEDPTLLMEVHDVSQVRISREIPLADLQFQ